jgi:glycosyltransferase involved in cell wall biosynthesis
MALGLAQVTNQGPGVAEIIERGQCGLCVDPNSPELIGAAVSRLLGDPDLRRGMGERARALHLDRYHYETQFRPVLDWIRAQAQSSTGVHESKHRL